MSIGKMTTEQINAITELQAKIHQDNVTAGWWTNLVNGQDLAEEARSNSRMGKALVAEKLCLIHSEVSESMEAARKNLMDDKLPHRLGVEVELADAVIRILDLCGALKLDLAGAIAEKLEFNLTRLDHSIESRKGVNGKAY